MKNETKLDLLLSDLKNFNIYYEEDGQIETLEELDDIEELYYEIQIELYNDDTLTEGWKDSIRDNFILKNDGTRVYMKDFADLVYSTDDEWRMEGDEKYTDLDEL